MIHVYSTNEKGTTAKKPVAQVPFLQDRGETEYSITIGLPPIEIYTFWRKFSNLALFMKDIETIETLSASRSKWTVKLKSGPAVEWIAEVTEDHPGEMIAWQTVEGEVKTKGSIHFLPAPADLGTVVSLTMDYSVPGGKLAELATLFTGESPELLILTNLKRLKAFLETGEIATTEGQPSGREIILENAKSFH